MADYIVEIDYEINDEPCTIAVTYYHKQPADFSNWDSDMDYYGYEEIEFDMLDASGKKFEADPDEVDSIEQTISDHFEEMQHDCD